MNSEQFTNLLQELRKVAQSHGMAMDIGILKHDNGCGCPAEDTADTAVDASTVEREPWENLQNDVCQACGSIVSRDKWQDHVDFHARVDQQPAQSEPGCPAHEIYKCAMCRLNPCGVDLDRPEGTTACALFALTGTHAESCPHRVEAISSRGEWRTHGGYVVDHADKQLAELEQKWQKLHKSEMDKLQEALENIRTAHATSEGERARVHRWLIEATSKIFNRQGGTPSFDTLSSDVGAMANELVRLRRLENAVQDMIGEPMGSDNMIKWLAEIVPAVGSDAVPAPAGVPAAQRCTSLHLRRNDQGELRGPDEDPELLWCEERSGHYDETTDNFHKAHHRDGGVNGWDNSVQIPALWPSEDEPPAGIDTLRDTVHDPNDRAMLRRHPDGKWGWYKAINETFDLDRGRPWHDAVTDVDGELAIVVAPI